MIRMNDYHPEPKELYGTSSDTKPTAEVVTGSMFVEVDTGKIYLFNEDAGEWVEQFALQE